MARPRKHQVSLDATSYYHCTSRCVRKAFLCGFDRSENKNYEHRREWVESRILWLTEVFAIDVCAYAVMSNHYHVVLHIDVAKAQHWTDKEVCEQWHKLYKGTLLTQKFVKDESLDEAELQAVQLKIAEWRIRLYDISEYMRALNEPIARQANEEDRCTGRFWQGRFSSQALLDEKALAACLAYVDLNPIRSKMAKTPETSEYTSIKKRIEQLKENGEQPQPLSKFVGNLREDMPKGLPFHLKDYIELVDWTGRIIRQDKRGAIDNNLPPILERLDIEPQKWITLTTQFESRFKTLVGTTDRLRRLKSVFQLKRSSGFKHCQALFG